MKRRNVLVFPAGTEIGMEILNALKNCKEVRLIGAGQNEPNHGKFAYPEYHILPSIYGDTWLKELVLLCKQLSIDYIFPAYDDVIVALSREQRHIPATVISSSNRTCKITRSKLATYRHLDGLVRVPHIFSSIEQVNSYPVLVKPDKGQGSFGIRKVNDYDELQAAISEVPGAIICEYLPGNEYTVDCFSDRESGLLFAGARSRRRVRNGISVNTVTEELPEVTDIAKIIDRKLKFRGAWFFQLKRAESGQLALLEIAPRIAGAMAAHRVKGINFPLLSIFEHERLPIKLLLQNCCSVELDRALCNRYRHSVNYRVLYVDLDDTLLLNGKVNIQVVKLIFQCINQGKPVKLLTRHNGNLGETLSKYRLNGLFDSIFHLERGEAKSDFITETNAIFVDDSFSERSDVAEKCQIQTFDSSMIEMLTEQGEFLGEMKNG